LAHVVLAAPPPHL